MTKWESIIEEILSDTEKFLAASPEIKFAVGIIQWNGKLVARSVYQPSPVQLEGNGETRGMMILPEPPNGWDTVRDLNIVPKLNGVPSKEDMPIMYLVMQGNANGLCIPARFGKGRVSWSASEDVIEQVEAALTIAGTLQVRTPE
jgi:hypothetical protein